MYPQQLGDATSTVADPAPVDPCARLNELLSVLSLFAFIWNLLREKS